MADHDINGAWGRFVFHSITKKLFNKVHHPKVASLFCHCPRPRYPLRCCSWTSQCPPTTNVNSSLWKNEDILGTLLIDSFSFSISSFFWRFCEPDGCWYAIITIELFERNLKRKQTEMILRQASVTSTGVTQSNTSAANTDSPQYYNLLSQSQRTLHHAGRMSVYVIRFLPRDAL